LAVPEQVGNVTAGLQPGMAMQAWAVVFCVEHKVLGVPAQ
jgi:hypothetical protein